MIECMIAQLGGTSDLSSVDRWQAAQGERLMDLLGLTHL